MRRILLLLAGLVISIVSLVFAFQGFNLGDVWDAMLKVQFGWLAAMLVPYILTFMTKVWRWRVMFHPDERRVPISLLFGTLMISYIPLPFRAGEVARGIVASTRSGIPAARVFSTIVVEKVLDILTLLFILGVSLPFVSLPREIQGPAITVAVGVTVVTLLLLALVLKPELARRLVRALSGKLPANLAPRIEAGTDQVLQGFAPMSNPAIATKIVLWSLATWGVNIVTIYCLLRSFNIEIGTMGAAVLVVATNLSMAVPAAPGSLGTFDAAVVLVLTALGQPKDISQTFALLYHFIGLVPVAILGVIGAIQQGIGLAAFRRSTPVMAETETGTVKPQVPRTPLPPAREER